MNYGGDEKTYIERTNNFFFDENFYFNPHYQYSYRWGMYLIPGIFFFFFGSNPITFFLASSIPTIFALVIYMILIEKIFDKKDYFIKAFLIFFLLWFFNPEIINLTYNLLTEGQGVFALSLVLYFFYKINILKEKKKINFIFLVLFSFYLYGIKEVNLFLLFPIVLITLFKNKEHIKYIILFSLFLFILECIFIWTMTDGIYLSRFHYFFFNENSVLDTNIYYLEIAKKFPDGGIISRWLHIYSISKLFFPSIFLIAIYYVFFKKNNINELVYYLSIILITYLCFVNFTFKSIEPLIAFTPIKIQNLTIMLPISFIIITYFLLETFKKKSPIKFLILILVISFFLRPINYFFKYLIPEIAKTNHNITNVYSYFNKIDEYYFLTGCLNFQDSTTKKMFVLFSKYKTLKKNENNLLTYSLDEVPICKSKKMTLNKLSY